MLRRSWLKNGDVLAIVDAGPLYAAADIGDDDHQRSLAVLERPDLHLVIPALVVAEVTYLVGRRLGARAESRFLQALADFDVEAPAPLDWPRIAELVEQYADFPLGGTDASAVALAERLGTDLVITLDRRHFGAVRPRHCPALQLLPA
jgi:predicted nucleic acid-binding protein